jgi:RimJ/RimL family protein N-acetyltransferase
VAEYSITPLSEENARELTTWQYDPPYDLYDLKPEDLTGLLNPDYGYHQVIDQKGILIGYCCFGLDAQVPGGDYQQNGPGVLDIGVGLRPDLTGRGRGITFVGAILDCGYAKYGPEVLRATIASFNQRSLRTFQCLGFEIQGSFIRESVNIQFYQLEKLVKEMRDG